MPTDFIRASIEKMASAVMDSLISNVEATLTFTLASKLVDMITVANKGSSITWILGAVCLMVLSIVSSAASSASSSSSSLDLAAMLNQILVLAFSRIVLMQVKPPLQLL